MTQPAPGLVTHATLDLEEAITRADFKRLQQLRWIGIAAEILVMALSDYGLGMSLPWLPLLGIVGLQIATNIVLQHLADTAVPLSRVFAASLITDIVLFTALLFFVGGARNPFVSLLLGPIVIAAAVLPRRPVWLLAALALTAYALLLLLGRPMPQVAAGSDFDWHVLGMGTGFLLVVGLIVFFVLRLAESLRQRERSLNEAREKALRDERLVTLGTLAAGAAHELGTPLSTMAIVAQELIAVYSNDTFLCDRLQLLCQQIERCKTILAMIAASSGQAQAREGQACPVDRFLAMLLEDWSQRSPKSRLSTHLGGPPDRPLIVADLGLHQALRSLLDNAEAYSDGGKIEFRAYWDEDRLHVEVADEGRGVPAEIRHNLGRRPLTTRTDGLGLGLFMGHAVIERLGGSLSLEDRETGGTLATIDLPLAPLHARDRDDGRDR